MKSLFWLGQYRIILSTATVGEVQQPLYQEHDRSATEDERRTDRIVSSSGDWNGNICDFYFRVY